VGQDAASIRHHCRNTNVVHNCPMTFQHLTNDKEIYEYQFFITDTFQIVEHGDKSEVDILNDFIKSDYFTDDFYFGKDISKEYPNHGPFDIKGLLTTDFKRLKPSDIENIINDISNDNDWGDDLKHFNELWSRARVKIFDFKMGDGTIFHLNKYWFKTGDRQLVQEWDYVFIYYLVFIYISTDREKLIVFDFGYD
jgi:hypothetical protein